MKTMKKFLSMAALALVGAVMTGCSSDDNILQPENKSKLVTLTTTISLDGGATTRALTETGVKTFAVGEQVAVLYYDNTNSSAHKAVSNALTASNISADGKTATITVTLDNPLEDGGIRIIYPAAMAKGTIDESAYIDEDDETINFDALNNQNGTLATLASTLDLAVFDGDFNGTALPTDIALTNRLSILALTLKNGAGSREITSSITGLTVSDGSNSYTVSRSAADGPIYVAIKPTTAALELTATDGSKNYTKTATSREYAAGNGYGLPLKMLTVISWSQSELEGIPSMYDNGSRTLKGVTLTKSDGTFYTYDVGKYFGGEFQFSSILGNLTKIEVTTTYGSPIGTGWSGNVWTGNSSTVDFEDAFNATNIVFTIAEDDVAVSSISLNKTSTSIEEGKTETLSATILPAEATDKSVTWTSSNPSAATVDASGVVTAVAVGEATITAEASNGLTATCAVTVTAAVQLSSLTVDGATIKYVPGETWRQAMNLHSSENAGWNISGGGNVMYGSSYLWDWDEDNYVSADTQITSGNYGLW